MKNKLSLLWVAFLVILFFQVVMAIWVTSARCMEMFQEHEELKAKLIFSKKIVIKESDVVPWVISDQILNSYPTHPIYTLGNLRWAYLGYSDIEKPLYFILIDNNNNHKVKNSDFSFENMYKNIKESILNDELLRKKTSLPYFVEEKIKRNGEKALIPLMCVIDKENVSVYSIACKMGFII